MIHVVSYGQNIFIIKIFSTDNFDHWNNFSSLLCADGSYDCLQCENAELEYKISMTGIENIFLEDNITILIPMSMLDGESMFPEKKYSQNFDGWTSSLKETEDGYMIAFTSVAMPLKNIHAGFTEPKLSFEIVAKEYHNSLSFSPKVFANKTEFTVYQNGHQRFVNADNDTASLIYLPKDLWNETDYVMVTIENTFWKSYSPNVHSSVMPYSKWICENISLKDAGGFIPVRPLKREGWS